MSVASTVATCLPIPGIDVRVLAAARHIGIAGQRGIEFFFDGAALARETFYGCAVALHDAGIDRLFEARLLHGDHVDELSAPVCKGFDGELGFGGQWSDGIGHDESKARNEGGVQPVVLGAAPLGIAEGLDAAGVDEADAEALSGECPHQRLGISSDGLENDAGYSGALQTRQDKLDAGGRVVNAERCGAGCEGDVDNALPASMPAAVMSVMA